jgi:hypothetical protein
MPTQRIQPKTILAVLLLAAPLLCAQTAQTHQAAAAKAENKAAPAQSGDAARQPAHEPFQITITFKRFHDGKVTTDRTYTMLATTGERLPAVRDDSRYRVSASDEKEHLDSDTDIDILDFKKSAESIYLSLRISTQTFTMPSPDEQQKWPVAHTHQYLVSPTVPVGKTVTVYSATDSIHDIQVEVQLLVQPFDVNQHLPQQP